MLEWRAILACNSRETKSFCGDYDCESLSTKKSHRGIPRWLSLKQNFLSYLGDAVETTEPRKANPLRKHSRSEGAPTSPEPEHRSYRCCRPSSPLADRRFALPAQ